MDNNDFTSTPETITIQLTRGYVAIVDAIDADLATHAWHAAENKKARSVYAHRTVQNVRDQKSTQQLHRVILSRMLGRELSRLEFTDHRDLNGLNCRRENLRLATVSQNQANTLRRGTNTSGFKGVSFRKDMGLWRAYITIGGRRIWLGYYDTPEAAHDAYTRAAHDHYGEFANAGIDAP